MQTLLHDLRYSLRQLFKNPEFSLTAVISLALGIGATTAVFSVLYAALMNPYPYPRADRIVRLTVKNTAGEDEWINLNGPQIQQLRRSPVVESVLAPDYRGLTMTGNGLPENVTTIFLSSNSFHDLGVPPVLGQGILFSDAIDGQDPQAVVVLSYRFWRRHFNSIPAAVGQMPQLDRRTKPAASCASCRRAKNVCGESRLRDVRLIYLSHHKYFGPIPSANFRAVESLVRGVNQSKHIGRYGTLIS